MRIFPDPDSKFMQILTRFSDLVVLNLVFLLTCLPIFTIGAANTALYAAVFPMDTPKEEDLLRIYFHAFRKHFRQGTVLGLLFLTFLTATCVNMVQFSQFGGVLGFILFLLAGLILLLLVILFSYGIPLLSQFPGSMLDTLKNALLLGIAYLPRTLAILAVNCFPWVLILLNLYAFIQLGFLWVFLYFSAAAYCNSRLLRAVLAPYRQQES